MRVRFERSECCEPNLDYAPGDVGGVFDYMEAGSIVVLLDQIEEISRPFVAILL